MEPLKLQLTAEERTLSRLLFKLSRSTTAIVAFCFLYATPAFSKNPGETLKNIEESLGEATSKSRALIQKAKETKSEIRNLRRRSVAVAAKARDHAFTLIKLEEQIAELDQRESEKKRSLTVQKKKLGGLISALQRIALHPPVALIALPATPSDTIRSALLLRGTVPEIETRARALRGDINALTEIRAAITAARQKIKIEQTDLKRERRALASLTYKKLDLAKKTNAAQRDIDAKTRALGKKAKNLRDLVSRLTIETLDREKERPPKTPKASPKPRNRKNVTTDGKTPALANLSNKPRIAAPRKFHRRGLPVAGRVTVIFGGKDRNGRRSRGITVKGQPGATVIAPGSGKIVFAGPFKSLGNLVIIEYSRRYHLLLSGLARIDVPVGEKVLAGEPVGIIPSTDPTGTTLYLELRRKGRPINPLPWLAAR